MRAPGEETPTTGEEYSTIHHDEANQELPQQSSKKVDMMKQDGEKLILCPSVVGGKDLMAALDTGAKVIMISTKAAEGMKGEKI